MINSLEDDFVCGYFLPLSLEGILVIKILIQKQKISGHTFFLPQKKYRWLLRFHIWPGIKAESHLCSQFEINTTGTCPFFQCKVCWWGQGFSAHTDLETHRDRPGQGGTGAAWAPHLACTSPWNQHAAPTLRKHLVAAGSHLNPHVPLVPGIGLQTLQRPGPFTANKEQRASHSAPLSRSPCSGVAPSNRTSGGGCVPHLPSPNRSQWSHGAGEYLKDS